MILKLTPPRIYYYHNKWLQVKDLSTLYQPTVEPLPNTQLDLFCSDNISFSMHGFEYVTNQFDAPILLRGLLTNLKKMLAVKFFNLSHDEDHKTLWLQNPTIYKHSSFFKRKMN